MSGTIPKMTPKTWRLWAKQQIDPGFFATGPYMSNIYSFDEELGVYLTFAGRAVVRQLEKVVWDEKSQAPADKTKQQIYALMIAGPSRVRAEYAPPAAELEALRIINGLSLPWDIVNLLTQTGWDPSKCCDPSLEPQERKLQPRLMGCTSRPYSADPLLSHPPTGLQPLHFNKSLAPDSFFTSSPLQTSMTTETKQVAEVAPKPTVPHSGPTDSLPTPVTKPTSLAAQLTHLEQMTAKTSNSLPEPVNVGRPDTKAATQKAAPRATLQNGIASSSKPAAKATPKTSRVTSAKTPVGWKRWARKQKNADYSDPAFWHSSKTVDEYLGGLIWDGEGKKPADISQQLPYKQLVGQWGHCKDRGWPLPASMMEAARILNSLVIPADIVNMLAEAGWDAEKCCNPRLSKEQKKLGAASTELKRSIEDEDESLPQSKRQHTTAGIFQKESSKVKNQLVGIPALTGQSPRESSSLNTKAIVKTEEASPKSVVPYPVGSHAGFDVPGDKPGNDGPSNYSYSESAEVDVGPCVVPNTNVAAINNIQFVDITTPPKTTKKPANLVNSSPRGTHEIDTSISISSKPKKHTSRRELKQDIDTVSTSLAVISADHSVKLQNQAGRLRECSENLEDHSTQLQKHSEQLQKQDFALAQLRHDNRALRDCLQAVLLPLAQTVNALRKLSKDDKRALKSTKKRAERGLQESKSADKNTKVLKKSFEHLRCVLASAESHQGHKSDAQGQED